jgi:hypothetical protein
MFQAFKTVERPTHVKFANGREEAIPDITPLLKPTPLGDIAAYTLFSVVSRTTVGTGTTADNLKGRYFPRGRGGSTCRELVGEEISYLGP